MGMLMTYESISSLGEQNAEEINHMAQKSAKNIIGHLHSGKPREKRENNNNKFRKNFRYVNIF